MKDNTAFRVGSELTRNTVGAELGRALKALADGVCDYDFAGVERLDSTALSFWLELLRGARARQLSIRIHNPPEDLVSIASLVGLQEVIR